MPGKSDKHAPVVNLTVFDSISLVDTRRHGRTLYGCITVICSCPLLSNVGEVVHKWYKARRSFDVAFIG
jgi:hypothetical protein